MKREVKIGLTVMAAIAAVYLMVTWVKSTHFFATTSNHYSIRFTDVNGLKEGDMVTVFGYPSGKVDGIRLTQEGAIADISLSDEVKLFEDVNAEILVKELMGGKQIEIKPGRMGSVLPSGSTFNGRTSLDFSSAFDRMGDFMEAFDPVQMDTLITNLNDVSKSFANVGHRIEDEDLEGTFRNLSESALRINRILLQMESRGIVARLDTAFDKLGNLADKGEETMESVTSLSGRLQDKTLPEAEALIKQLNSTLTDTESMIVDAKDMLAKAKDNKTVAGRLLYDEEATKEFDLLIDNLNETLEFLRTKKVHVAMSLRNRQKEFGEEPGEGVIKDK